MIILNLDKTVNYLPTIQRYYNSTIPVLIFGVTDVLTVYNTNKKDLNLTYCNFVKAVVINYSSNGGAAVSSPGDLGVYFGNKGNHLTWPKYILQELYKFLMGKGLSPSIENNDLTLYSKKVLGYTTSFDGEYTNCSIFIAMNNSQDLVSNICLKPKTRQTAGFHEYGITKHELIEVIIKSTQNYLSKEDL